MLLATAATGCGGGGDGKAEATATATVTVTADADEGVSDEPSDDETTESEEPATDLQASDFTLRVKITGKQCFGSAGCNVDYEIEPSYNGFVDDLEGITFDLTYQVRGDESGPQIGTIQFDGGSYDVQSSTASTRSNNVQLVAKPTEVSIY